MPKYLMAIDAGTGSVRSVVFDLSGKQVGVAQREWVHDEDPRFPGSMDFNWTENWKLTVVTIREVIAKTGIRAGDILAVSTTSMREGIVLYDREGQEIWACANVDARGGDEVAQLKAIRENIERDIYHVSGQSFALGALCRLLWVKNHLPDVYERTKTVTMINDWLMYKLSGVLAAEPSNGCTTGIFDLRKRKWEPSIAGLCGLKDDIFPEVHESGESVGTVSEVCTSETGLSSDTKVVMGGGDAQLGALGAGLVSDGQTALFGGSFWQLETNTATPIFDEKCRIRINCHAVKDIWQYEAIAFYPGLVMRWYRDAFCQGEKEIEKRTGEDAYMQMDRQAALCPPGSNGLLCAFSDVMDYIAWRHASPTFTNFAIDPERFNRYTFYRAIMENAAYVSRGHLELVKEVTGGAASELVFANGASKSPLWCQIIADVTGLPVKTPRVKESTALGAAICAGIGAGVYQNAAEACDSLVKWECVYEPHPVNQSVYDAMYDKWKRVYKAQRELADQNITVPMWKAPGL